MERTKKTIGYLQDIYFNSLTRACENGKKEIENTDRQEYKEGIQFMLDRIAEECEIIKLFEFLSWRFTKNEVLKKFKIFVESGKKVDELRFVIDAYGIIFKYDSSTQRLIAQSNEENKIYSVKFKVFLDLNYHKTEFMFKDFPFQFCDVIVV